MDPQDEREDLGGERRKNPSAEKAWAYRQERRYWYAHAHQERRDWPKKKALRNQSHRQQVKRSISRALATANDLDEVSPDRVRRVKSRRLAGAVKLDAWVQWKLTLRRMRAAASFFKQPYNSQKHREPFLDFLHSLTGSRTTHAHHLAQVFRWLVVSEASTGETEYGSYSSTLRANGRWLRAFFRDEPEWEPRLRAWIAALTGPTGVRDDR